MQKKTNAEKRSVNKQTVRNAALGGVGGAATGAGTVAGAMVGVGAFGTASTGTAISTLSGAAAYNATLAWFGGGAMAAGGSGIALGTAVLTGGGIVVAVGAGFGLYKLITYLW
jgi:hypothetical protein